MYFVLSSHMSYRFFELEEVFAEETTEECSVMCTFFRKLQIIPLVWFRATGANNWREYQRYGRTTVKLTESGAEVFRWPRFSFKFTCELDFSRFPYDVQVCPIVIRPGVVPMSEVEIVNEGKAQLLHHSLKLELSHIIGYFLLLLVMK